MENTFRFNTIAEFHSFCQLPNPEHPLISLVDYSQVKYPDLGVQMKWVQNFYTIGLKRNVSGKFNYGQTQYDFNTGLLSFVAPLQCLKVEINPNVEVEPTGWLLLIHPDFLWNTGLAKKIKSYDFFQYAVNEALFMSNREEEIMVEILRKIQQEYQSNMDKFSQELIVTQIELLLIYAERFYERQFHSRKKSSFELLDKFEHILTKHFTDGNLSEKGIPTVADIAEQLHISPNYLGSILRIHTSQNTQQHIQNKLIDYAKQYLSTTNMSVSEIAFCLGFEHSQSFSKLFKLKTQQTPLEFRQFFN